MYGNPYYNQNYNQLQRFQPLEPVNSQTYPSTLQQPIQQTTQQIGLLGKSVDSIDVVKGMDIPLDGRISYFPLTDGSAIVTKQLQNDGTSKVIVYKPSEESKEEDKPNYITAEEVEKLIPDIDIDELREIKDEIKTMRKQMRELKDKIK